MKKTGFVRQHTHHIATLQKVLDPALVTSLLALLYFFEHHFIFQQVYFVLLVVFLLTSFIFSHSTLYRSWRAGSFIAESRILVGLWFLTNLCLWGLSFVFSDIRSYLEPLHLKWALLTLAVLILERLSLRFFLRYFRSLGKNIKFVVIAGAGNLGQQILHRITDEASLGMKVVGFFDDRFAEGLQEVSGFPVLGTLSDIDSFVQREDIDIVYIALPLRAEAKIKDLAAHLHDTRAYVYLVPDIFIFELLHTQIEDLDGIPVLSIFSTPFVGINGFLKRQLDILLSLIIITLISPILFFVGLLIRLKMGAPVLFKQTRYGLNGEKIRVYKFRTMTVCESGETFKQATKGDARVTPLGSFLRKTSLDELPQFFNVLMGDMSIVGPRPHPVALDEKYRHIIRGYMLRARVKPGITGLAQVNGWRGETDTIDKMRKRFECDLEYIRRWSLWLDIKIIFLTMLKGFLGKNAY